MYMTNEQNAIRNNRLRWTSKFWRSIKKAERNLVDIENRAIMPLHLVYQTWFGIHSLKTITKVLNTISPEGDLITPEAADGVLSEMADHLRKHGPEPRRPKSPKDYGKSSRARVIMKDGEILKGSGV